MQSKSPRQSKLDAQKAFLKTNLFQLNIQQDYRSSDVQKVESHGYICKVIDDCKSTCAENGKKLHHLRQTLCELITERSYDKKCSPYLEGSKYKKRRVVKTSRFGPQLLVLRWPVFSPISF